MRVGVVDIGGTRLKSGLFLDGALQSVQEAPSHGHLGGAAVLRSAVAALEAQAPFERIGVSTAGQVDPDRGVIRYANSNIPDYTGTNVRQILEDHFHVPVFVENDVCAAAIGEARYGAARTVRNFLCLTYGTGVGGAIVLDNRLYRGAGGTAGFVGHLITHGEQACDAAPLGGAYERHASTSALVRSAAALDPALTDGRRVLASLHRPEIRALVDRWIGEILCGLASLVWVWNPSLIVLGGGIMAAPYVITQLQQRLPAYLAGGAAVSLLPAALGNRAGMMGVGHLAAHGGETADR